MSYPHRQSRATFAQQAPPLYQQINIEELDEGDVQLPTISERPERNDVHVQHFHNDRYRQSEYDQYEQQYDEYDPYYDEQYDEHGQYDEYADYTHIGRVGRGRGFDIKMVFLIGNIVIVTLLAIVVVTQFLMPGGPGGSEQPVNVIPPQSGQTSGGTTIIPTTLSPLFMPSVLYWENLIVNWANVYGVDPNAVATIMQIESCGDPQAISVANAQGLFQVMPFHFEPGEQMLDPDTNAKRGVAYFAQGLQLTGGDPYLSFAGYNGGHGTAARGWNNWSSETQRYYVWSKGIYDEVSTNQTYSATLQEWLNSGGAGLCRQAETRLGI